MISKRFPGGSVVKNPSASSGDAGSIPASGSSPGEGNGNPFQYSCLGNPVHRGAWQATVHRVTKESDAGGRREEGSGWGTHVYLWWIHFDIWQN